MKYLNAVLVVIAALLFLIFVRLGISSGVYRRDTQALIASNQQLEKTLSLFSKQIEPITKRFAR